MVARIADSALYGHLWGTDELRGLFDERARIASWLEILVALAHAQADHGVVPRDAAAAIEAHASVDKLDLDAVAAETRRTGHSTLGLIRGLQEILPESAREWVYYGTTVQDVTDTWMALTMKRVGSIVARDALQIEQHCLRLAREHRDTPMVGRTHGQPGAPITFGFKAATWGDEMSRHRARLEQGRVRWTTAQLGGAVGTLSFFGDEALKLRHAFCERLELREPAISWLSTRDRPAEFVQVLALVTATLGRIANEVLQLQRPEIGELREASSPASVGSITMPHKRNPECSEQVVTLARLVRANAGVMVESMVSEHERDGRSWKAEWVTLPEVCLLAGTALSMTKDLLGGLEVDRDAMRRNLEMGGGSLPSSERILAHLAPKLGKHRAQALLQDVLAAAERGVDLRRALSESDVVREHLGDDDIWALVGRHDTGAAQIMVDDVLRAAGRPDGAA